MWSECTKKKCTLRGFGAPMLQIIQDRLAGNGCQWVNRRVICLSPSDVKPITLPIDIVQRQCCDLASTQPIGHKQQENRVIAPTNWSPTVYRLEQPPHFVPGDGARQIGQPIS